MKKILPYLLLLTLPVVLYPVYLFTTTISFFLATVILSCITYFIVNLHSEREIALAERANPSLDYENAHNKRHIFITLPLLLIIFFAALITEKRVMKPGANAYFKNTDHHGLNHYAISFTDKASFAYHDEDDSGYAAIQFRKHANGYLLQTEHFDEPIFQKTGRDQFHVVNALPGAEVNQCIISNGENDLRIQHRSLNKSLDEFVVNITSQNTELLGQLGKSKGSASIRFTRKPLQYGLSLRNFFNETEGASYQSAGDYELLNEILEEAGSIYILANSKSKSDKNYILFKTASIGDYRLLSHGQELVNSGNFIVGAKEKFYIGFAHHQAEMHLDTLQNEHALFFDYPNTYYLSSPGESASGTKCTRFICNQNEQLKETNLPEGFCFENSSLTDNSRINGLIEYISGNPTQGMQLNFVDRFDGGVKYKQAINNTFYLRNERQNLKYHFKLRDFSDNGFSYHRVVWYTFILFLLFTAFTIFSHAGSLRRFQPIALFVIFSLIVVRFILYWRIATFPPLENISNYELENTFRQFDFNILGVDIPVPATLVFTFFIFLFIAIFRRWQRRRKNADASKTVLVFGFLHRFPWSTESKLIASYCLLLVLCGVMSFLPIDFLKRIATILLPTLLYIFYAQSLNEQYRLRHIDQKYQSSFVDRIRAYIFYLVKNPTFNLTLISIAFFAMADRGYCVLFILFVLLKNILLNFLKKSIGKNGIFDMFTRPWNYWIYGVGALLLYFVFIVVKSLFYFFLTYKLIVIAVVLLFFTAVINLFDESSKKLRQASWMLTAVWLLIIAIPQSRAFVGQKISNKIKHVQYRASIIHQAVSDLLEQNDYSSFSARKIIETAENQWFINSYISNEFDYHKPINFKSFTKVGVNYNTQTRDVVVARFIIGEWGAVNMYLILIICILPLVFYLVSYKIKKQDALFEPSTYAGLIPMLIFFTLCLFVWLTSTNRFVFFGQDYPFLSLTSKLSVLLPLMLFLILLIQQPATYNVLSIKTELAFSRYLMLFGLIVVTSALTVIKNELNQNNFNVVVNSTKTHIEQQFDNVLAIVQDSLDMRRKKVNYDQLCKIVTKDERYRQLYSTALREPYTQSIFRLWEKDPASAMRINNPLYIRFDQGRFRAEYNNTLYLTLPISDNRKVWHGVVCEADAKQMTTTSLTYARDRNNIALPFFTNDQQNNLSLAILPATWLDGEARPRAIIDVHNQYKTKTTLLLQKREANTQIQSAVNFSKAFNHGDIVTVDAHKNKFDISFNTNGVNFVSHKWVNNAYRAIFSQGKNNFWVYHLTQALRTPFKNTPEKVMPISIDYNLSNDIQNKIRKACALNKKNKKFNFSVIAADGDGYIRTMNDFNGLRTELDPNDPQKIYRQQQDHFFYSNTNKERKQWGNANLLSLHLGPGSSIKPAVLAAVASQAKLEWERLMYIKSVVAEESSYAGLPIAQGWKNIEHYGNTMIGLPEYIEHSSNFFHSVILFLGSYATSDFADAQHQLSLKNVLTRQGKKNTFPKLQLDETIWYLPNFSDKKWPYSDPAHRSRSYFANENSLLARGMSGNLNVATSDIDKQDGSPMHTGKTLFFDSVTNNRLKENNFTNSIWVLPEASSFPQRMRHFISSKHKNELNENFNLGLKTPTLGGYPYQLTPHKMLEMYNALFTQNRNYHAGISRQLPEKLDWQIDSSWTRQEFNEFLANNVFTGMKKVIQSGTGTRLQALNGAASGLFLYAKTGTINEESSGAASSRRLILTVTNKDMTNAANIGTDVKVYSIYFVVDNNRDFDWNLVLDIASTCMQSRTFLQYFGKNHE